MIRSERRLVAGIAVSILLHGVLLSLQFGVPGSSPGSGGPIAVVLAPQSSVPDRPPVFSTSPVPPAPDPTLPAPPLATTPSPVTGLRLVDLPPAPIPAQVAAKADAGKSRPKRTKSVSVNRRMRELSPPVIVAVPNPASGFTVPLPEVVLAQGAQDEESTAPAPEPARVAQEDIAGTTDEAEELVRLAQGEQHRFELEQTQERERIAQEQRVADQQAAQRQRLVEEQALQMRQDEARMAQEAALAARLKAELTRERERQELATRQLTEQRAAEQASLQAQADVQAEAQRNAREQAQRVALAQEQAERQRLEAQRLAQEQHAERQRIEELHQRRLAQERAQQQADERARAERLVREQADEAARQAAAERLQAQAQSPRPVLAAGSGQPGTAGVGSGDGSNGSGSGARSQPGAVAGLPGSRARELLRGLTIPGAEVPLTAPEQGDPRRVVADGGERDAPLRLYVDSVRQKLERNAVLGGARLALREVRIDPLVSLALRSDGSIDAVTIIRSSGRPDMDEAVRRFVQLNARYAAFPPNVAARFDVIEIRRIWRFTDSLKLLEEMR
jgi:hypothetical protein